MANNPPEISLKEVKGLNGREFWLSKPAGLAEFQPLTHQNKSVNPTPGLVFPSLPGKLIPQNSVSYLALLRDLF